MYTYIMRICILNKLACRRAYAHILCVMKWKSFKRTLIKVFFFMLFCMFTRCVTLMWVIINLNVNIERIMCVRVCVLCLTGVLRGWTLKTLFGRQFSFTKCRFSQNSFLDIIKKNDIKYVRFGYMWCPLFVRCAVSKSDKFWLTLYSAICANAHKNFLLLRVRRTKLIVISLANYICMYVYIY